MAMGAARAGAKVMFADVDSTALRALVDTGTLPGSDAMTHVVDIADLESCRAGVSACLQRFGKLDVLVNNAGRGPNFVTHGAVNPSLKFWETDPARWALLMQTNVVGTFQMAHAAAPHMIEQGFGRIINISTSLATMYRLEGSPYGVSKAAIETQTMIWARDLAGSGVTVNALLPGGAVDTDFVSPSTRAAARAGTAKLLDAQIMVDPLLWLASNSSGDVSGARLVASKWLPTDPLHDRIRSALEEPILRGSTMLKGDRA
jgi:3-oxoacyl-[acyl-carrier protein] reductase